MIKVDLHMHTGEDPKDGLPYKATELIDKAAALEFGAIAITLHGAVLEDRRYFDYASEKGVLLIPAVEWRINHRDVLLYNVSQRDAELIRSFGDLRAMRKERGNDLLVIAPHPHFPVGHSLREEVGPNMDVFDAIEHSQVHLPWLNFNKQALHDAREYKKPVVATSDAHALWMFGRHYSVLDAERSIPSIFRAIREGRLQWHSPPVTVWECLRMFVFDPLLMRRRGRVLESFPATQSAR
jgi:predicted metal-dependent phosphoesterase TrpH